MLDHLDTLLKLRTQLLTAQVCTTGSTTLTAIATGFTRDAGSFVTDGLRVGMEVVPTGFTDNSIDVIKYLTATEITLYNARPIETPAAGRALTVGIPTLRGWENDKAERIAGRWYFDEDYLPGPAPDKFTLGQGGQVETEPTYVVKLEGIPNTGTAAMYAVAHEILLTFPPALAFTLDSGDIVHVRTNPAPYRSKVINRKSGNPEIVITIPLVVRTSNPI